MIRESWYKVRFKEVAQAIGMKPENFNRDVREHPTFGEALDELGIVEVGGVSRKSSFQFSVHSRANSICRIS